MSEWGRIKQNMAIGSNFGGAATDQDPQSTDTETRDFRDLGTGGLIDFGFIQGDVLEVKRIVVNAGDAEFWNLALRVSSEAGAEDRVLFSEADFAGAAIAVIRPSEPLIVSKLDGEQLLFTTLTGAGGAASQRFIELLVSRW